MPDTEVTLLFMLLAASLLGIGIGAGMSGLSRHHRAIDKASDAQADSGSTATAEPVEAGPSGYDGASAEVPEPADAGTRRELAALRVTLEHEHARRCRLQETGAREGARREALEALVRLQRRRLASLEAELLSAEERLSMRRYRTGGSSLEPGAAAGDDVQEPPRLTDRVAMREGTD